jgi:hypothetical protein
LPALISHRRIDIDGLAEGKPRELPFALRHQIDVLGVHGKVGHLDAAMDEVHGLEEGEQLEADLELAGPDLGKTVVFYVVLEITLDALYDEGQTVLVLKEGFCEGEYARVLELGQGCEFNYLVLLGLLRAFLSIMKIETGSLLPCFVSS